MPRLTPRLAAIKQHRLNEQVLALLGVMPVRLDVTKAEIDQIRAEAELQTDRLPGDEDLSLEATRRHKLHSQRALAFQVEVYRRYCNRESVRESASALRRSPSSVQRALEAARALAGDRYKLTADSRSVVFAETVKCAECRNSQALWGRYCKTHDQKLAAVTETDSERKMADDNNQLYEYKDNYWSDQSGEVHPGSSARITDLDS